MNRWNASIHRVCPAVAAVLLVWAAVWCRADDNGALDANKMKVALHTATPQEGNFIENIVANVQNGGLPLDLVQSTFLWAKKKPHKKFYYFKRGLILRAAQQGIRIDDSGNIILGE
jgi:hypothetical protein